MSIILLSLAFCSFHSVHIFPRCPVSPPPSSRRTWQIITGQSSAGELYLSRDKSLWHNWAKRLPPRQRAGEMRGGAERACEKKTTFFFAVISCHRRRRHRPWCPAARRRRACRRRVLPARWSPRERLCSWVSFLTLYLIRHKTVFKKKKKNSLFPSSTAISARVQVLIAWPNEPQMSHLGCFLMRNFNMSSTAQPERVCVCERDCEMCQNWWPKTLSR